MTRFRALSLAALALPVALQAQGKFEGTVTMQMTAGGGNTVEMLYSVKGDRIRTDLTSGQAMQMYFIREGDKNDIVMPAQKMYMEQSISASMAAVQKMQGRSPATTTAKVTRTGKKETIAGYECEHVVMSDQAGGGDVDACLAQGLGTFMAAGNPMGGRGRASADPMSSLANAAGFPLKVQKVGGETVLLVTKIEKKPLDDGLFAIPSDYKKMDMGGMMGRPPQL